MNKFKKSLNRQRHKLIKFMSQAIKLKTPRKGATEFVKRMVELQNRLAEANNRQLWDSLTQGTYRKTKHGQLRRG